MVLLLLAVFVIGAVTVVAMEAFGLWIFVRWLTRKVEREEIEYEAAASASLVEDLNSSLSLHEKQGALWVLEPEKVPKSWSDDKLPTEQRRRKDILEVTPVKKYARINDRFLIITELDGSRANISLRGCKVAAVSATSLSSKKWAKRYPIKLESTDSVVYKGSNIVYLYLETSWEKESWCKALRLSCDDDDRNQWFSKLNVEFHKYLSSLNVGWPSVAKPYTGFNADLMDKPLKHDNSSSKVRQFLRKLARRASKNAQEYKSSGTSISGHEEKIFSEKSRSFQESILSNGSGKNTSIEKPLSVSLDDTYLPSSVSTSTDSGIHFSKISDSDLDYKIFDEGTICLNMLISRLFFDIKSNPKITGSMRQRIQNSLSNMRMPSYIGEVTCTALDPGNLPPRILAMRALPSSLNEMLALEIDLEYLGGIIFSVETRLEVRELELEGEKVQFDTNTVRDVTSDLLEGYIEEQLKHSKEVMEEVKQKDEAKTGPDENDNSKTTQPASSQTARWKSILHSLTKQVSQVPISLRIKISSLRGTMRLYVKPPPSDQIWFGFTSMPDIDCNLEPSVGDRKITSTHLALLLISRFKVAIRESLVLPNRGSLSIPWMLAEKDDWVPRNVAPFLWYKSNQDSISNNSMNKSNQDSISNNSKRDVPSSQSGEASHSRHGNPPRSETNLERSKTAGVPKTTSQSVESIAASSRSLHDSTGKDSSFEELKVPLIEKDIVQGFLPRGKEDGPVAQRYAPKGQDDKPVARTTSESLEFLEGGQHSNSIEEDDARAKRVGTRERMFGLGKKMGEKLEMKRRNIEERGRSFVERMRTSSGPEVKVQDP